MEDKTLLWCFVIILLSGVLIGSIAFKKELICPEELSPGIYTLTVTHIDHSVEYITYEQITNLRPELVNSKLCIYYPIVDSVERFSIQKK